MTANKRIFLNVAATYGRSLLSLAFGLFTSRWVLLALGKSDFGLYGLVGSIIVFITYLNLVLSGSVTRFFAFSIGQGNLAKDATCNRGLQKWFNVALSLHLTLAVVLVGIGGFVGTYAIRHWLVIPPERVTACVWVFRMSLFTTFISIVSVPYVGMFTAHQNIAELTIFDLFRIVGNFVGCYLLLFVKMDRLVVYAAMMVGMTSAISLVQMAFAKRRYSACRIKLRDWFDLAQLKELMGFAGWRLFGVFGWLARSHGSAILINLFFGSIGNAAYAVATQVSAHTTTLSNALLNAMSPALTTFMGEGNEKRVIQYAIRASKISGIMILMFAVPLACECDYVLRLWLTNPPEHSAQLCMIFLLALLIDNLSNGYMMAIGATGRISWMTVGECVSLSLTVLMAWAAYQIGYPFEWIGWAFVFSSLGTAFVRVAVAKFQFGIPCRVWILQIFLPVLMSSVVPLAMGLYVRNMMVESFLRLLCVVASSVAVLCFCEWCFILNGEERCYVVGNFRRLMERKVMRKAVS